ncbi:MAG TPA: hypothetical protein VKW08_15385 [Xanthobacteraceae bacterium]|jgi:hypothetical protein|nr:hypothetical protein [Xanthobacteraceae bacterium]
MQFNPKIGFYLGILVTIEIAVSSGTLSLTHAIPPDWIPAVIAWSGILAFIGSTILTFLHGYSSIEAGPLVNVSPPPKAVTVLVGLAIAGALMFPGMAYAQGRQAPAKAPVICDPLHLAPGCQGGAGKDLSEFTPQEIADRIGKLALNDFVYADALAKATNNTVTEPCWAAWVKLLTQQQQPLIGPSLTEAVSWGGVGATFSTIAPHNLMVGQGVTFASPPAGIASGTTYYVTAENYTAETFEVSATVGGPAIVPTGPAAGGTSITSLGIVLQRPDPGLITNVEYLSEAVQLLQSNSPIAVACAPMAQALQKDVGNLLGQIITGGAFGLFKLPIPVGAIP